MKRILIGMAIALFAPAMAWADCDYHNAAAMASSTPSAKADVAKAPVATKAPVVAKAPVAKQVKQAGDKATAPKTDGSTVLAKTN